MSMKKIKKYPKIEPRYEENHLGKKIRVVLDYDVYKSIFDRIQTLQISLKKIEKSTKK
jgi:hypothetical protein